MLRFIIIAAISIWTTSSLFMLYFWANAFITTLRESGKVLFMPLGTFFYIHFCPIVHTKKCFDIMRQYGALKEQREV